jgi:hypothetical protein
MQVIQRLEQKVEAYYWLLELISARQLESARQIVQAVTVLAFSR